MRAAVRQSYMRRIASDPELYAALSGLSIDVHGFFGLALLNADDDGLLIIDDEMRTFLENTPLFIMMDSDKSLDQMAYELADAGLITACEYDGILWVQYEHMPPKPKTTKEEDEKLELRDRAWGAAEWGSLNGTEQMVFNIGMSFSGQHCGGYAIPMDRLLSIELGNKGPAESRRLIADAIAGLIRAGFAQESQDQDGRWLQFTYPED